MRMSARTSSMTAAPRTTLAKGRLRTPISDRTRLVIPMLVAASARPTKAAVAGSSPTTRPMASPAIIGRIIAMTPVRRAGRPTASRSSMRTSRPTENSRMTTPISARTSAVSPGVTSPRAPAPTTKPPSSSPTTAGWPSRRATSSPSFAPTNRMKIPSMTSNSGDPASSASALRADRGDGDERRHHERRDHAGPSAEIAHVHVDGRDGQRDEGDGRAVLEECRRS